MQAVKHVIQADLATQTQRLTRLPHSTIVFVTGLQAAGKTSVLENLIARSGNGADKIGVILNERDVHAARADAARLPLNVHTAVLNRCSCCSAQTEVLQAVESNFVAKREIVFFEPSGYSDGVRLVQAARERFDGKAHVKWLHLVNFQRMKGPSHLTKNAIANADGVLISHTTKDADLRPVIQMVSELRRKDPTTTVMQNGPGDIGGLWDQLIVDLKAPAKSNRLQVANSFNPSALYLQERALLDKMIHLRTVVVNPELNIEGIAHLINTKYPSIIRAKGDLVLADGAWSLQFFRADVAEGQGSSTGRPVVTADTYRGTKKLENLLSITSEIPLSERDLISLGVVHITEDDVKSALESYPSASDLKDALNRRDPIQGELEEDKHFFSVSRIDDLLQEGLAVGLNEDIFLESIFDPSLIKFIEYRILAHTYLQQEDSTVEGHHARLALNSWHLAGVLEKYGVMLRKNPEIYGDLFERAFGCKPGMTFLKSVELANSVSGLPWQNDNSTRDERLKAITRLASNESGN